MTNTTPTVPTLPAETRPPVGNQVACICGCGAMRDVAPHRGPWICAICGTVATPANSLIPDGQCIVHRGCLGAA